MWGHPQGSEGGDIRRRLRWGARETARAWTGGVEGGAIGCRGEISVGNEDGASRGEISGGGRGSDAGGGRSRVVKPVDALLTVLRNSRD
jgi:hypothetical protein